MQIQYYLKLETLWRSLFLLNITIQAITELRCLILEDIDETAGLYFIHNCKFGKPELWTYINFKNKGK